MESSKHQRQLKYLGFSLIQDFYTENEVNDILNVIQNDITCEDSIEKSKQVFAIRQLLKKHPQLIKLVFNKMLIQLINQFEDDDYFLTKAIYFDKPSHSNWFVPFHQDLSISVNQKTDLNDYCNWTHKEDIYGVQPPVNILNDTVTLRIHLDDTTRENGALKVIPKSHLNAVIRKDSKYWNTENGIICNVNKGGIMLMKPLILHASDRTTNGKRRRVIHLEFNKHKLQQPLKWLEYLQLTH